VVCENNKNNKAMVAISQFDPQNLHIRAVLSRPTHKKLSSDYVRTELPADLAVQQEACGYHIHIYSTSVITESEYLLVNHTI
jgi:hypothetical protein